MSPAKRGQTSFNVNRVIGARTGKKMLAQQVVMEMKPVSLKNLAAENVLRAFTALWVAHMLDNFNAEAQIITVQQVAGEK